MNLEKQNGKPQLTDMNKTSYMEYYQTPIALNESAKHTLHFDNSSASKANEEAAPHESIVDKLQELQKKQEKLSSTQGAQGWSEALKAEARNEGANQSMLSPGSNPHAKKQSVAQGSAATNDYCQPN